MDGYGKRILVVGDQEHEAPHLADSLAHAGYNVHRAADGLHALLEMMRRRFDAVITDDDMPRMNGREFVINSRRSWPNMPVILLSVDAEEQTDTLIGLEAFACVRKPYEPRHLLDVLRGVMLRSQETRRSCTGAQVSR